MSPRLRPSRLVAVALFCSLVLPACTVGVEIGRNDEITRAVVLDVPARKRDKIDLLFVVDNTSNMSSRQLRLAQGAGNFIDALRGVRGTLPDLHLGVISPDLGAGSFAGEHATCSESGHGGALLVPSACEGIDGNFLQHTNLDGTVTQNYVGELDEAFACMTALGEGGCDYEQPLEAMRLALSGELLANQGFLRPSAVLGVVFVTDEDDCSAKGERIFDPSEPLLAGDEEWRCFSAGVRCGTGDDVFPPGWQADCIAREDSSYVNGIEDYINFARGLKGNPSDVVLAGIIGEPDLVRVEARPDNMLGLEPACGDPSGEETFPGVRMRRFLDATRAEVGEAREIDSSFASLCEANTESGMLSNAANRMRTAMGSTCLRGRVVDIDADTPGQQVDCYVSQVFPDREEPLAACDNRFNPTQSSFFPCYTIEPGNDVCSHEPTRLSLRVVRSATPDPNGLDAPIDARLQASCVTDDAPIVGVR